MVEMKSSSNENTHSATSSEISSGSPPPPDTASSTSSEDQGRKILDLSSQYSVVQRNGQRIYGGPPPDWSGPPPAKGSEIFVGKVPRNCSEAELVPIFAKIGRIYELRLMMDFNGCNRGYFFVRYCNPDDAKRAVQELNNYEIRPNKRLGVLPSVDNRKLWISGIPKNRTADEIKEEMAKLTEGVNNIILYPSQTDKTKTRGYAFVEYESHRAAALARRTLVPKKNYLFGQEIDKVDWAEPEQEVDEETMSKVRVLFLRNLQPSTTESQIRRIFEDLGGGENLERVKKSKDYAFVHFQTRAAAEKAIAASDSLVIDDAPIEVTWSKPVDKQTHNQRKFLTKVLSSPAPALISNFREPPPMSPISGPGTPVMPPAPPAPMAIASVLPPRKRGAAGIKGLGAPGTTPPRRLLKWTFGVVSQMPVKGTPVPTGALTATSGVECPPNQTIMNGNPQTPTSAMLVPNFYPYQQAPFFITPTSNEPNLCIYQQW